jgi:hypothetical protein
MRLFALFAVVVLVGCTPTLRDNQFACMRDDECPAGFDCVAQRCSRAGVDANAAQDAALQPVDVGFDATSACNPLGRAECAVARVCELAEDGARTCGAMRGAIALGSTCAVTANCVAGAVCSESVCRQLCLLGAGTCPARQDCTPYASSGYGVCVGA